jgi:hypothetical protein
MPKRKNVIVCQAHILPELHSEYKKLAKGEKRSVKAMTEKLIADYVEKHTGITFANIKSNTDDTHKEPRTD